MKYITQFANATDKNLCYIKLHPEDDIETELLKAGDDNETLEAHYHRAVEQMLGSDYVLLAIVETSQWPFAAQVRVQRIVGLGS